MLTAVGAGLDGQMVMVVVQLQHQYRVWLGAGKFMGRGWGMQDLALHEAVVSAALKVYWSSHLTRRDSNIFYLLRRPGHPSSLPLLS